MTSPNAGSTWEPRADFVTVVKPSLTARVTDDLLIDPALQIPVKAGEKWLVVFNFASLQNTTGGAGCGVTAPAASTGIITAVDIVTGSDGVLPADGTIGTPFDTEVTYQVTSSNSQWQVRAYVVAAADGTVGLLWGQHVTDAGATTVVAGSTLVATRIP